MVAVAEILKEDDEDGHNEPERQERISKPESRSPCGIRVAY
jgi:hypothetical protein